MLNALRRGSKGFLAKILIALLVMSFAVWGISDFVNQVDPTEVARAGDTPVTTNEFARIYQRELRRIAQTRGTGLTPEEAMAEGVPQQIVGSLVFQALQVDAARALGLDVGDETLAERIRAAPVFAGADGAFDRSTFDLLLAENRYTEPEFIALERDAAVQEMWVNGILGGYTAPTAYLEALNTYMNQTRQITWFELTADALGPIPDPSDEELRAFHEENASLFRAPERRSFSFVTLSAEALAEPETISDEAVRSAYERDGAYGEAERRHVQQIVLDDPVIARTAVDAVNEGTDFETILAGMNKTFEDVDLGLVERRAIVDPAVREAAFGLEEGRAAFVDGRFGPVLVRVSEIREAQKRPFEEVEAEIRSTLAADEAADLVNDIFVNVEDAAAGGALVGEMADRFGLPLTEVEPVSRTGVDADGTRADVPREILATAFAVAPGDDPEPVRVGSSTMWLQVDEVVEAAERPYEEVAGDVIVEWTESERTRRLAALAGEAVDAVAQGTPIADVARRHGAEARTSDAFSRSEPPQDLPSPVAAAAFEGAEGHEDSVVTGPGSHIVFEVTEVSSPAFFEEAADLRPIRTVLDEGLAQTLVSEFLGGWQAEVGATENPTVINQIVGIDARTR